MKAPVFTPKAEINWQEPIIDMPGRDFSGAPGFVEDSFMGSLGLRV